MERFRQRIEGLRTQRGLSARALSLRIGQNPAYIQQLESGMRNKKPPGYPVLVALANEFQMSVDELLDSAGAAVPRRPLTDDEKRPAPWMTEPIESLLRRLGARPFDVQRETEQAVSAGKGKGMVQQEGGSGSRRRRREPDEWVVRVEGRCMYPQIKPGEEVVVEPDVTPRIGDLVVATLDGDRFVLKHLVERENVQYLLPLNGDPIPLDDLMELRIVGVVRGVLTPPPSARRSW